MSKLCAPVRDDEIAELRKIREVVPLFQGIMKTMENMKLDMANFMVQQVETSKIRISYKCYITFNYIYVVTSFGNTFSISHQI